MRQCCVLLIACALWSGVARAEQIAESTWTEPVAVKHGPVACVSYRARIAGDWLLVEAVHHKDWHSFAIDNDIRAEERLAGKKPLGIEAPTKIEAVKGIKFVGRWHQPKPADFSKPELRWFAFGFESKVVFASRYEFAPQETIGAAPAVVRISGQTCNASSCRQINVELMIDPEQISASKPELRGLEPVKVRKKGSDVSQAKTSTS